MIPRFVTRRGFLGILTGSGLSPPRGPAECTTPAPAEIWIILGVDWQYNDEFNYAEGETVQRGVYFSEAAAMAACEQLCRKFYTTELPADFPDIIQTWLPDWPTSLEKVTWADLLQAGYPGPYHPHRLQPTDTGVIHE